MADGGHDRRRRRRGRLAHASRARRPRRSPWWPAGRPCGSASRPAIGAGLSRPALRGAGGGHQYPSSSPTRRGHLAGGPQSVGPGEQVREVEHGHRGVDPLAESVEVGGPGAPHGDGEPGRVQHRPGVPTHELGRARPPARSRTARRRPPPPDARTARGAPGSPRRRPAAPWSPRGPGAASSIVSVTGISSGVHTATSPVIAGSDRISSIQSVCVPDEAHLDQVVDRLGGGQLPDDVARGRRVDHHQVVAAARGPRSRACRR